eukprot:3603180-Pyramimonas_sp.AAC.1
MDNDTVTKPPSECHSPERLPPSSEKKTVKQARVWTITLRPTTAVAFNPPLLLQSKVEATDHNPMRLARGV